MKKIIAIILCISIHTIIRTNLWDDFKNDVSHAVHTVEHAASSVIHTVTKPVTNYTSEVKNLINTGENKAPQIETNITNLISAAENLAPVITNSNVMKNVTIIEQAPKNITIPQMPSMSMEALIGGDLTDFFKEINKTYAYIQAPLQASFNLINTLYSALSVAANLSQNAGQICKNAAPIFGAMNFAPINTIIVNPTQTQSALDQLGNVFEIKLPQAFTSLQSASKNMETGFNNLYLNMGNTLHTIQKQVLAMQKALAAIHKIESGSIPSVPPQIPAPPPPPSFGPPVASNGQLPPPPPPPPLP